MSNWIKVQPDQLPPKSPDPNMHIEVIVYVPELDKGTILENGVCFGRYLHTLDEWQIVGGPSNRKSFRANYKWEVTHWQAKPQPPKVDEESQSPKPQRSP